MNAEPGDRRPEGKRTVRRLLLAIAMCLLSASASRPSTLPAVNDSPSATTKPGAILANYLEMNLVYIPPGEFQMGSPESERGRQADEGPQHLVRLTKGFYLGATEVTQAQYERVCQANPSQFKGANLPVDSVTFAEAQDFCRRLTTLERAAGRLPLGEVYRLPTEAEWEYACRAGSTGAYASGDDPKDLNEVAWFNQPASVGPHVVGARKPNAWGLYDMHGNAWEWCADWYEKSYAAEVQEDPTGPRSGESRVLRGGAWSHPPAKVRAAARYDYTPGNRHYAVGFRVVRTAVPTIPVVKGSDNGVGMKMVLIQAGEFMMGSPATEALRRDREPQPHPVRLTKSFFIAATEVTQAQYEAVMARNPSVFRGADLPVENVSWHDAVEFCRALTAIERQAGRLKPDKEYRLPTEAEWEYTCRAGCAAAYCFGDDTRELGDYCWFIENAAGRTHPVAEKKPNAWGLYDMHGNVFEWCSDWYADNQPPELKEDPEGAPNGTVRVMRGGAWTNPPRHCRSADRSYERPEGTQHNMGFRCVRTIADP
jgi:formylglycine-generating enzyme required for sulfatase activity